MEYNIYCDCETFYDGELPSVEDLTPPKSLKKPETIEKWRTEEGQQVINDICKQKTLDSMENRILCVSIAINDEAPVCYYDEKCEKTVLEGLQNHITSRIDKHYTLNWIGHNMAKFDAMGFWRKAIKYNLGWLARNLNFNRYKGNIRDTQIIWACENYQDKFRTLDAIAKFLDIEGKSDMDGSMVRGAFLAGEHEKIKFYCNDDVRMVREVYLRIDDIMSMNQRMV